jgi:hypothetical protein
MLDWYGRDKSQIVAVEARYVDCCLSDWFQGYSAPEVLAVPVYPGMTYADAKQALKDDYQATMGGFFDECDGVENPYDMINDAIDKMFLNIKDLTAVAGFAPDQEYDEDGEPVEEDDFGDSVYLYVALIPVFSDDEEG